MTERIERRAFLAACAAVSAGAALGTIARAQQAGFVNATVQVGEQMSNTRLFGEFLGLSFDASLIPGGVFFNGGNRALIDYVRGLGRGVLQFGGPNLEKTTYAPDDFKNLADFANAADWRVILGLPLTGPEFPVADQAAKATQILGERLAAFELGSAPDLIFKDYGAYLSAFRTRARIVTANAPTALFAGPSTASHPDWASRFVQDARAQIVELTQQYLHTGGEEALYAGVHAMAKPAGMTNMPYRIEQIASTAGNNVASALWALDFAFQIAVDGAYGANFKDNADASAKTQPLYPALQMLKESVNGRFLDAKVNTVHHNFSAHAVQIENGPRLVTLLNRDSNTGATVSITPGKAPGNPRVRRLTALSMDTTQINVVDWRPADLGSIEVPPASAALVSY